MMQTQGNGITEPGVINIAFIMNDLIHPTSSHIKDYV